MLICRPSISLTVLSLLWCDLLDTIFEIVVHTSAVNLSNLALANSFQP